jgi:ABC-type microcin C transport system duplicated ATPase subunit YejF
MHQAARAHPRGAARGRPEAEDIDKYPPSPAERQRLSIARALITRPKLIVADEPVSALDVSIRAQILDLFADLNGRLGVAYLFITHDLTVARAITDDVMVMDEGRIVETGKTAEVLDHPQSDAARALVAATRPTFSGQSRGDFRTGADRTLTGKSVGAGCDR